MNVKSSLLDPREVDRENYDEAQKAMICQIIAERLLFSENPEYYEDIKFLELIIFVTLGKTFLGISFALGCPWSAKDEVIHLCRAGEIPEVTRVSKWFESERLGHKDAFKDSGIMRKNVGNEISSYVARFHPDVIIQEELALARVG